MRDAFVSLMLVCALAISSGSACTRVSAQDVATEDVPTQRYVVVEGDSCADIAARFFGDRRRHDIIHAFNPGMGPPPHDLVPGTVLILPLRAPRATDVPDARVTALRRDVLSRRVDSPDWFRAARGLSLFRGWRVNTLERSSAELTFADTSRLEIRANTLVIVYGAQASAARAATGRAVLERGTLRTRLGSLRLQVDTPSASADVEGGTAVVATDDTGSRIASHEGGGARVRRPDRRGRAVTLAPGFGSVVPTGRAPSPPRPLLPAPALAGPSARRFFAFGDAGASIAGELVAVPGAARHRIEVLRLVDGQPEVVADAEVGVEVTRFVLEALPPGEYRVTFATIDDVGLEGIASSPLVYRVDEAALTLPPTDDGAASPDGTAAPGVGPLRVPLGTEVALPSGVTCEGQEGRTLRVAREGRVVVPCTSQDGLPVQALVFEVPVAPPPVVPSTDATTDPEVFVAQGTVVPPAGGSADEGPGEPEADAPVRPITDVVTSLTEPSALGVRARTDRDVEIGVAGTFGVETSASVRGHVALRLHRRVFFDVGFGLRAPSRTTWRGYGAAGVDAGLRGLLLARPRLDLVLGSDVWVPMHPRDGVVEGPTMRPTVELDAAVRRASFLRMRLASMLDFRGDGPRTMHGALAFDHAFAERYWFGLELRAYVGRRDDALAGGGAFAGYLAAGWRHAVFTLFAQGAPFDPYAAEFSAGLGVRYRADVPEAHRGRASRAPRATSP